MGYRVVKKAWQYIQPFWYSASVERTDRQTSDGRTDVQPISITCFSIADAQKLLKTKHNAVILSQEQFAVPSVNHHRRKSKFYDLRAPNIDRFRYYLGSSTLCNSFSRVCTNLVHTREKLLHSVLIYSKYMMSLLILYNIYLVFGNRRATNWQQFCCRQHVAWCKRGFRLYRAEFSHGAILPCALLGLL